MKHDVDTLDREPKRTKPDTDSDRLIAGEDLPLIARYSSVAAIQLGSNSNVEHRPES